MKTLFNAVKAFLSIYSIHPSLPTFNINILYFEVSYVDIV